MNHIKRVFILFSFFVLIAFTGAAGLQVQGNVGKLIPVTIKGYQGEVAKVLAFDLEVMGCKMVPEAIFRQDISSTTLRANAAQAADATRPGRL